MTKKSGNHMMPKKDCCILVPVALVLLLFIICSIISYNYGKEQGTIEIKEKLLNQDCIEEKIFECPSGEQYMFCDRYETKGVDLT